MKKNLRKYTFLLGFTLLVLSCGTEERSAPAPLSPSCAVQIGKNSWQATLATSPKAREEGLMYRNELPPYNGMLFSFDPPRVVAMWMKNTYIPLDMVFINAGQRIAIVHRNAKPFSEDILRSEGPVAYVLEMNAGEAASLRPGQRAIIRCR